MERAFAALTVISRFILLFMWWFPNTFCLLLLGLSHGLRHVTITHITSITSWRINIIMLIYRLGTISTNIMFLDIIHCPVCIKNIVLFIVQNIKFWRLDSVSVFKYSSNKLLKIDLRQITKKNSTRRHSFITRWRHELILKRWRGESEFDEISQLRLTTWNLWKWWNSKAIRR
jgi:hypothetical protein